MAIESYFFNAVLNNGVYDRVYDAQDIANYLQQIVSNGVFPNPSTQLQVRSTTGMTVAVGAGSGWINGHKMNNTSDYLIAIDASDVLLNRIDRVIFYLDMTKREMGIGVLKGEPSTAAVPPVLTRNNDRYEMSLALIYVNKQVTALTNTMVHDTRMDTSVCGFVHGLITQLDTTTLYQQYNDQFNNWFNTVKELANEETLTAQIAGLENDVVTLENNLAALENGLANKSIKKAVVTLPVNNWVANGSVWTQTVAVSIVTSADEVIMVSPVDNVAVRATGQAVGSLTFTAYEKPASAVPVNVVNMGV